MHFSTVTTRSIWDFHTITRCKNTSKYLRAIHDIHTKKIEWIEIGDMVDLKFALFFTSTSVQFKFITKKL